MLLLNKPLGLTPYQTIQRFKQQNPHYEDSTLSPAGRLDPMAEGLLLILENQENKQQAKYLKLDKIYQVDILFGISTDSYDLLGLPQHWQLSQPIELNQDQLAQQLHKLTGNIEQSYPPYSAVQVNGKPLYYWARKDLLNTIKIPKNSRDIYAIEKQQMGYLSTKDILKKITKIIPKIQGDYRQQAIVQQWQNLLSLNSTTTPSLPLLSLSIHCSSGTYVRSLAHSLGQSLGVPTLAYRINRTQIGSHRLDDPEVFIPTV